MVDDRCERRRLSRARGPGDEDESTVLLRQATDAGRQRERLEVRHLARDDAERDRDRASLAEAVDAEPRQAGGRVGAVELSRLEERLQALGRLGADLLERELQVAFEQLGLAIELGQSAVAAQHRRSLHLEVDVACAKLDGASEHEFEIHRQPLKSAGYSAGFSLYPPDEQKLARRWFIPSGSATTRLAPRSASTRVLGAPRSGCTTGPSCRASRPACLSNS